MLNTVLVQFPGDTCPPFQGHIWCPRRKVKRVCEVLSPVGLRDRAVILTLTLTGRRRSEVLNLEAGNISVSAGGWRIRS